MVRVPGLDNFADTESNIWRLTGNTGKTGYSKCYGAAIEHPVNHFLKSSVKDSLQKAIADYFVWTGTQQGANENLVLHLNDMSLLYGGLFDICGDWEPGHKSHRLGVDLDIGSTAHVFNNSDDPINLEEEENYYLLQELVATIRDRGGQWIKSIGLHFRF